MNLISLKKIPHTIGLIRVTILKIQTSSRNSNAEKWSSLQGDHIEVLLWIADFVLALSTSDTAFLLFDFAYGGKTDDPDQHALKSAQHHRESRDLPEKIEVLPVLSGGNSPYFWDLK